MKKKLCSLIGKQILFFDGATGTVLQDAGLKPGELPETWNVLYPERIVDLHYSYLLAGANIIKTNTFGAFSLKFPLKQNSVNDLCLESIIIAAVKNAKAAVKKIESEKIDSQTLKKGRFENFIPAGQNPSERSHFIALDIGPSGKLLKPMGDLDFEDAVTLFKTTIKIGLSCGVDAILIETMNDCYEAKAAVIAAKESIEEGAIDIPVFCTTVYDDHAQLLTGADPETVSIILEGLGIDALGMNCGLGPVQMETIVSRLINVSSVPVIVNPNAGLPRSENGKTFYDIDSSFFAQTMYKIVQHGACLVGGCCGTTPEYICKEVNFCQSYAVKPVKEKNISAVSSYTHTVNIGKSELPVLIGERINPTGKKKFKQALREKNIPYIIQQGLEQEKKGAAVLDVNVGLPEIDEKDMMVSVVTEIQSVMDIPLQIDTSSASVMEAALRRYNGKALVNSVNGKEEVMASIFPLVKKYGGVVVALTIDENGIPETSEERLEIAEKIYDTAAKYGILKKDIIIDPLAMAVSADSNAAIATLNTVKSISEKGCNTILGVSNVSFGLPHRELITETFFTMALQNGLNAAIMNPKSIEMMKAFNCFCTLKGKDPQCLKYIEFAEHYEQQIQTQVSKNVRSDQNTDKVLSKKSFTDNNEENTLKYAVVHGLKEVATKSAQELIKTKDSLSIINNQLIPALDVVGNEFEQKRLYLPQLLMSAEAAKSAFSVIKDFLVVSGKTGKSHGKIILATVKGDIHDIGKNIVKVLLENYDYTVIDLGKDVPPDVIVDKCIEEKVPLVGLSALMTTTVPSMEETIKLLRKKAPWAKICVGGAVLTQQYADMIGADFYGKDAMESVRYAQMVMP